MLQPFFFVRAVVVFIHFSLVENLISGPKIGAHRIEKSNTIHRLNQHHFCQYLFLSFARSSSLYLILYLLYQCSYAVSFFVQFHFLLFTQVLFVSGWCRVYLSKASMNCCSNFILCWTSTTCGIVSSNHTFSLAHTRTQTHTHAIISLLFAGAVDNSWCERTQKSRIKWRKKKKYRRQECNKKKKCTQKIPETYAYIATEDRNTPTPWCSKIV